MLLADGLAAGMLVGLLRGGSLSRLQAMRVKGESLLIVLLAAQVVLPRVVSSSSEWSGLLLLVWLLLMTCACVIALLNARTPGMTLVSLGIALNALVIVLNGAMPVSVDAVKQVDAEVSVQEMEFDFLHEWISPSTALPFLADVIAVPGPRWHRGVASVGDLAMVLGVVVLVQHGMVHKRE